MAGDEAGEDDGEGGHAANKLTAVAKTETHAARQTASSTQRAIRMAVRLSRARKCIVVPRGSSLSTGTNIYPFRGASSAFYPQIGRSYQSCNDVTFELTKVKFRFLEGAAYPSQRQQNAVASRRISSYTRKEYLERGGTIDSPTPPGAGASTARLPDHAPATIQQGGGSCYAQARMRACGMLYVRGLRSEAKAAQTDRRQLEPSPASSSAATASIRCIRS